jgi:hypothetical protein
MPEAVSTDPGRHPEPDDLSQERLQDEEAARGPAHDDPDDARERAGLERSGAEGEEPPLPGPDAA